MIATPTDPCLNYIDKYDEPLHHMAALLEAHIITLDIPPRILFPLSDAGVRTVGELVGLHRSGLVAIRGIGVVAADEIERILVRAELINVDHRRKG